MEALYGNGDEVLDGNGEQVVNETINSDSCVGHWGVSDSQKPFIMMKFESQENAYSLYFRYVKSIGFGISIKTSWHSKVSIKFIDVTYVEQHMKKKKHLPHITHVLWRWTVKPAYVINKLRWKMDCS